MSETQKEGKPRVSYADFLATRLTIPPRPTLADFTPRTVAWLIQRVIDDVKANPLSIRQHGQSASFALRRLQKMPIGRVIVDELSKHHIIEFGKERRKTVKPCTVKADYTFLRGVINHASAAFSDCEHLSCAAFEAAKPFLIKNNLVGKADRRTRLPTGDEIERLLDDLAKSDARKWTRIKMVPVVAFGLVSARRRSEVCSITHGDVDYVNKVYVVRDMKHPTAKKGNDKTFVLWPELEQIIKLQPRLRPSDPTERIFPYNPECVTKRYIDAKKRCGIENLHLHDNRGKATSNWLLKLGSRDKVRKLVTGHDSEKAFDIYDRRSTLDIMRADEAILAQHMTQRPAP